MTSSRPASSAAQRLSIAFGLGLVLVATRAAGQSIEGDQIRSSAAQVLFEEARRLMQERRFAEACPKLAESYRLEAAAGTLLNLALCYEQAGKPAAAWLRYHDALALAVRDGHLERQEIARTRILALESTLATLRVVLPEDPVRDLWVSLDGVPLGPAALGIGVPVDPGPHEIRAGAPGKRSVSLPVVVDESARPIELKLPQLADDLTPPKPVAPSAGPSVTRWLLLGSALGVGVSGLVVGTYFGLRAQSDWNTRNEHCREGCDARAVTAGESARRAALVSTIGWSAALVAGAAAVYLLLTGDDAGDSGDADAVDVRVAAGLDHAWLGAGTEF